MISVLLLATAMTAVGPVAPISVQFTNDSVYKYESIISPKELIKEEDSELYTIVLEEDKLLGYAIYDDASTSYIEGLVFDDDYVTNWVVEHVDLSKEHRILVKTVYTDDVAGMLAAAKNGDWSRALSNPLILLQLFYYLLAAISLIVGGIGLVKAKAKKIKDHEQIANSVKEAAVAEGKELKEQAICVVTEVVTPVISYFKNTQDNIIKALILAQSGDKNAALDLVNLLQTSTTTDVTGIVDDVKKAIEDKFASREKAKAEAAKVVKKLAKSAIAPIEEILEDDGTSI